MKKISTVITDIEEFVNRSNLTPGSDNYYDCITYYYKHFIDALPMPERQAFHWMTIRGSLDAKSLSKKMRVSSKQVSATLIKMQERGIIKKLYRVGRSFVYGLAYPDLGHWYCYRRGCL